MNKNLAICGLLFLPFLAFGQSVETKKDPIVLDSIIVSGNRAGKKTPIPNSTLSITEIRKASSINSLPLLLNFQPSVVSTTEGAGGLGNSSISVRGSDASRINVTLNGVAINDSESQQVFWVNLPALSSIVQSVQLQRGVGTSTNGPGAFGASINLQTLYTSPEPNFRTEASVGSYNTFLNTFSASSGLLPSGLSLNLNYSHSSTDGYVRNGKGEYNSLFASLGYLKGNNSLKINYIFGDQKTGITWEGVSKEEMEKDRRANPAGRYYDAAGNVRYYDNETDNYTQHHSQLFYSYSFSPNLHLVNTINYTRGDGYYENYKYNRKYSSYGLSPQTVKGTLYKKSDVIVRQSMANNYFVASSILKYKNNTLRTSGGVHYSLYHGRHFGRLIWSMYNQNIPSDYKWYENYGNKWEINGFGLAEVDFTKWLTAYVDLQYRHISLNMGGADKDFANLDYTTDYNFFNPKVGATFTLDKYNSLYASLSVGHKEPSRNDIKEAIKSNRGDEILPERMLDYEIGYQLATERVAVGVNLYLMEYKNQLVATGKLNEVGYVVKENVPKSYRRGVELTAGWKALRWLRFDGNLTLSTNKILDYTLWVDTFDSPNTWGGLPQTSVNFGKTDIAFSPNIVGMGVITIEPFPRTTLSLNGKYVGKQYYDNTSSSERCLPSYYLLGANASYQIPLKKGGDITLSIFADNITNNKFVSNAWVYRAIFADGSTPYLEEGFYPQPEANFVFKVAYNF